MEGVQNVSPEQILENSDFLSLHTPLNPSTQEMINADSLSQMKKTAVLVFSVVGLILQLL